MADIQQQILEELIAAKIDIADIKARVFNGLSNQGGQAAPGGAGA